jgi:hypothetical protein
VQLGERIEALVHHLLPRGVYYYGRRRWRVGSVAGEAGQSLCVCLDGPRRGRWRDYAGGEESRGDALDLVAAVVCDGDKAAACRWARAWLGLGRIGLAEAERLRLKSEMAREERQRQAEREAELQARAAKAVWLAGRPLQPGDPAWSYLAGRGIELDLLPAPPAALRLHPELWNPESGRHWPALVAAICLPDGKHVNTHRIWLAPQSEGEVKKAPLRRPKLSMPGGYAGGCVRLWRGASGRPWSAMPDSEILLVGEGLKDVLTIVCARPEWRAAAVLSVSSLARLVLPAQVVRLIWIAQNDPPGSPAAGTVAASLKAHRDAGRMVAVIRPPPFVKDVAEYAERHVAEAV